MLHLMLWMLSFYHSVKTWVIKFRYESNLNYISNMIWRCGFVLRLLSFIPMERMCLILLNMHLFYWRLVLIMSLYLQAVMTCTSLHFPFSCWLDMAYKTCWKAVDFFLPILRIQTLFLFLAGNTWFHGLLFVDW